MSESLLDVWAGLGPAHPRACVAILLVVSILAGACVAFLGVDQSFNVSQFQPGNEADQAFKESSAVYGRVRPASLLLTFHPDPDDGGTLHKRHFLATLELERKVFEDPALKGSLRDPDDWQGSIISPISLLSLGIMSVVTTPGPGAADGWEAWGLEMGPLLDPATGDPLLDSLTGDPLLAPTPSYDNLILTVSKLYSTGLRAAIHLVMADESEKGEGIRTALRSLLSSDFRHSGPFDVGAGGALVIIYLRSGETSLLQAESRLVEMASEAESEDIGCLVLGWGLVSREISDAAMGDLVSILPLAVALILAFLVAFTRSLVDSLATLAALGMALLWLYGCAALSGQTLTPLALAVPFLVVGVGTDYAIHMVFRFREELGEGEGREEAVGRSMRTLGQALALSVLTTCVAYLSNISSEMPGMVQFGALNALGIFFAFIAVSLLIPSVLVLHGGRGREAPGEGGAVADRLMGSLAGMLERHGGKVLALVAVSTLCMGAAAVNVGMGFDPYQFLPEGGYSSQGMAALREGFPSAGLSEMQVLVGASPTDPAALEALQGGLAVASSIDGLAPHGGRASPRSIFDVWQDWARVDGPGDHRYDPAFQAAYEALFQEEGGRMVFQGGEREELEAMLALLEGSDLAQEDMARFISLDGEGSIRVTFIILEGLSETEVRRIEAELWEAFGPLAEAGHGLAVTGEALLTHEVVGIMRESQMVSVLVTAGVALALITLVGALQRRQPLLGLISLLPTMACIVWMWGAAYLAGLSLNPLTMTVAAITVGLGVDYAIHMGSRYQGLREEGASGPEALEETVRGTGKGLMGGAVTTAMGFGALVLFSMRPMAEFGAVLALSILASLALTLLIMGSVLSLWGERLRI